MVVAAESLAPLNAAPTYADLYGADHALASRACDGFAQWLPPDRQRLESMTGNQIAVIGGMGLVCNAGTVAPDILALLGAAGFAVDADIFAFRHGDDYATAIADVLPRYTRIVTHFVSPPGLFPAGTTWIPEDLLGWLNNKRNLGDLVPVGGHPRRVVTRIADLLETARDFGDETVMVKVATDLGNGGGTDVMRCRTPEDLRRAATEFAAADALVVESFVDMTTSYCHNYWVGQDGTVRFLGAAEQVCSDDNLYLGNIVDCDRPPPVSAITLGETVARAASDRGFYGVCGFDIAIRRDGPPLIFDLNFRSNGCTTQLLIEPALRDSRDYRVSRLYFTVFEGKIAEAARHLDEGIENGWLVPLGGFDPFAGGFDHGPARLQLLVLGDGLEEIEARIRLLRSRGFS